MPTQYTAQPKLLAETELTKPKTCSFWASLPNQQTLRSLPTSPANLTHTCDLRTDRRDNHPRSISARQYRQQIQGPENQTPAVRLSDCIVRRPPTAQETSVSPGGHSL